jgi:preprotein translocase subunit SecE
MAEVLRKKTEDKYNTESIKKSLEKKKDKKQDKKKKVEKKTTNRGGFKSFCGSVAAEFKKVHWPSKKDMVKYSIATIAFIIFFGLFFYIVNLIFAFFIKLF